MSRVLSSFTLMLTPLATSAGLEAAAFKVWIVLRLLYALFGGLIFLVGTGTFLNGFAATGVLLLGFAASFAIRTKLRAPAILLAAWCLTWGTVFAVGVGLTTYPIQWPVMVRAWPACLGFLLGSLFIGGLKGWFKEPRPRPPLLQDLVKLVGMDRRTRTSDPKRARRLGHPG